MLISGKEPKSGRILKGGKRSIEWEKDLRSGVKKTSLGGTEQILSQCLKGDRRKKLRTERRE